MHKNILLVEDDETAVFIYRRVISSYFKGSNLTIKQNGQEAIDYLIQNMESQRTLPSLIFLDLNMPVMNGFEFLTELQNETFSFYTPLISILTSSMMVSDQKKAQVLGCSNFITKPLDYQKISNLLSSQHEPHLV